MTICGWHLTLVLSPGDHIHWFIMSIVKQHLLLNITQHWSLTQAGTLISRCMGWHYINLLQWKRNCSTCLSGSNNNKNLSNFVIACHKLSCTVIIWILQHQCTLVWVVTRCPCDQVSRSQPHVLYLDTGYHNTRQSAIFFGNLGTQNNAPVKNIIFWQNMHLWRTIHYFGCNVMLLW